MQRTLYQYESWNKKAQHGPQLGMYMSRDSNISSLCKCHWMKARAPWVFTLGLQIVKSENDENSLWLDNTRAHGPDILGKSWLVRRIWIRWIEGGLRLVLELGQMVVLPKTWWVCTCCLCLYCSCKDALGLNMASGSGCQATINLKSIAGSLAGSRVITLSVATF